ncbi:hypothetical protein AAC387_Pa03g0252 [Persea americana]
MKYPILFAADLFLVWTLTMHLTFAGELALPDGKSRPPGFMVSWVDDKNEFRAGDIATIKIKVLESFDIGLNLPPESYTVRFTLTVNGRKGNSSTVSGVLASPEGDSNHWNITFIPIMVGRFPVIINDYRLGTSDATLHFSVTAGRMHPSVCVASWMNLVNEFVAGTAVNILVMPKDAFGNNISSTSEGLESHNFTVSASYENGTIVSLNVTYKGWNEFGYIGFEFVAATAGSLSLHVGGENQTLNGSPLPFKVKPGPLNVGNCLAKWKYETNALQIFSKLEIFIHQQDQFGNLVPDFYSFDARIVEKSTNLSIPVADSYFQEVAHGIQLLSFVVSEPGDLMLTVFDPKTSESISNTPYDFTVFIGYSHGQNSVANGSGLTASVAGQLSSFSVYLEDVYHNPSPVEAERFRVQVKRKFDSYNVRVTVLPTLIVDVNQDVGDHINGTRGNTPSTAVSINLKNITSSFNVIFTPEKSGSHEIWVFCGNIPLNGGVPYMKEVLPGVVDASLSNVEKFSPKVAKVVQNEIVVHLMDSFSNPVVSQQSQLRFQPVNNQSFLRWTFVDNNNGSYVGQYQARDLGRYNVCVTFEDKHLSPCPFEIDVYEREYFPKAYDDNISVWENESIAFDALGNDYFADNNASIVETSIPHHGSLLQYGRLFRYTPYKGFYGNDSFSYSFSDKNNNVASGTVNISVLSAPPQFVSLPTLLQATEDVICPRFGGFPGFEIKYSDPTENISVTLSTQSGSVFLAPMPMQFLQPWSSVRPVGKGDRAVKDLILVGNVEVINFALQFIQYLGNENFSGNDVITVSTMNKNGIQDARVPIIVEPINDSPSIRVPEYVILEKGSEQYSQIVGKQDSFEFSVEDPDLLNFPDNESHFVVTLSMEVNTGILKTVLSFELINVTEVKPENSYHWQPLQNFVTISNHFVVKGKGVRFRGTIKECNAAMQQMVYRGADYGTVLSITVNDMGNYGCYPDCSEKMSSPLFAEAAVNLIKRRPMTSLVAHSLGSAIIIEFIIMLLFGVALLFFICKCAIALGNERRNNKVNDNKISKVDDLNKSASSVTSSENLTYFTGCSTSFLLRKSSSDFRQRSHRLSHHEGSRSNYPPAQFGRDGCQQSSPAIEME